MIKHIGVHLIFAKKIPSLVYYMVYTISGIPYLKDFLRVFMETVGL